MATSSQLGEAHVPIRATMDKLDGDLAKARSKIGASIDKIVGNLQTVGAVALSGVGVAAGVIAGVGAALSKVTIDAAPVEGIADAFDGLADSAGVGGKAMLEALRKGSSGMVANRDLMRSFNDAASLVSLSFAQQLPDAMQYLSKVSAATGEDMGYLMDSLVKGVGRLSPPILDNLKIQVSLAEATARAAEMFGVEESALDKAQVQAGMMSISLEKLAANTAAMPDATQNAAAKMAQMKATFQNTKDQIGMAFLPVLDTVMGVFGKLAEKYTPVLTRAIEKIAPVIAKIVEAVDNFVFGLENGQTPISAFASLIGGLFPPEVANQIVTFAMRLQEFGARLWEVLQPVAEFIMDNVQLSDVLAGVGVAIATLVIPAIGSMIAAVAPVIGTFLAVVAVVALLRAAWENDFLGIRTALTEFWENKAKPAFTELAAWLKEHVPAAIAKLKDIWDNQLLPALSAVWEYLSKKVFPVLKTIAEFVGAVLGVAFRLYAQLMKDVVIPAIVSLYEWFSDKLGPVIKTVSDWLGTKLKPAFDEIWKVMERILGRVQKLTTALQNLDVAKVFKPGSPTPFEMGLRGIDKAMGTLSGRTLPQFSARLELLPEVPGVTGFVTGGDTRTQLDTSALEKKIDMLGMQLPLAFRDAVLGLTR